MVKTHLKDPRNGRAICGTRPVIHELSLTVQPKEATCKRCYGAADGNPGWYEGLLVSAALAKAKNDWIRKVNRGLVSPNRLRKSLGFAESCSNCGDPIKITIFQGTNYCSENCRKDLEEKNNGTASS